jgi:hypothetical protein
MLCDSGCAISPQNLSLGYDPKALTGAVVLDKVGYI